MSDRRAQREAEVAKRKVLHSALLAWRDVSGYVATLSCPSEEELQALVRLSYRFIQRVNLVPASYRGAFEKRISTTANGHRYLALLRLTAKTQ
jgi:hypothetical protein